MPDPEISEETQVVHHAFSAVLYVGVALFRAFALLLMWGWFVVPLGAPDVGYITMVGFTIMYETLSLTYQGAFGSAPATDDERSTSLLGAYIMLLFIAWCLTYWGAIWPF